jgi:hypothetical protein
VSSNCYPGADQVICLISMKDSHLSSTISLTPYEICVHFFGGMSIGTRAVRLTYEDKQS